MSPDQLVSACVDAGHRLAWSGPTLLVADAQGGCSPGDPLAGLYFREARHLRTLELTLNGERPRICAEGESGPAELDLVLVYPELRAFEGGGTDVARDHLWRDEAGVPQRAIDARLRIHIRPDGLKAELVLANRAAERVRLRVAWRVDADFADLQQALGGAVPALPVQARPSGSALRLRLLQTELPLETEVRGAGPGEWSASPEGLVCTLELSPRQQAALSLRVRAVDPAESLELAEVEARLRKLEHWRQGLARVATPGAPEVGRAVRQSLLDLGSLALLEGAEDEWLAVQAGLPYYPALFGRDALTAGWQAACLDRGELLESSLTRLGRLQGRADDPARDEQPGRIVQQCRRGPLARLGCTPFGRYYADYASPLMYPVALAHHYSWSGDRALLRRHWDTARRILDWARERGDLDGDGYLEYQTESPEGPAHQGWKDSGGAIVDEAGRPVSAPLATCELQGYWYAAQQLMAVLGLALGDLGYARALWRSASRLKARFNRDFWLKDEGYLALALGPGKRPIRSVASNAGHCLTSGIVSRAHRAALVERLFAPDLFSGWGIRTLSRDHPAYSPLSYHRGSVWPVENATIAFGLRRFGFDAEAQRLAEGMLALSGLYARGRVPECVGGYARAEFPHPGAYPRANPIQAWNQSSLPLLVHTLLGLQPVAPLGLLVVDPALPSWLPEVVLRDVRLGEATATVRFWRDARGRSHAELLARHGRLRLIRQPPLEARAGLLLRLAGVARSLRPSRVRRPWGEPLGEGLPLP